MAAIGNRGTVTEAAGFKVEEDVNRLRGAMKGAGTDEAAVIEVLARRSIAQRQRIKEVYKQTVGKDLTDDLQGELTGNFENVVLGLLMTAPVYDAYELRNAMKGAGTEEAALIDILASRTNAEIRAIAAVYIKDYEKNLEEDIDGDTSGMFQRVLVSLLTAGRDESNTVDEAQAVKDAKDIYEAGEARWGTEITYSKVLSPQKYFSVYSFSSGTPTVYTTVAPIFYNNKIRDIFTFLLRLTFKMRVTSYTSPEVTFSQCTCLLFVYYALHFSSVKILTSTLTLAQNVMHKHCSADLFWLFQEPTLCHVLLTHYNSMIDSISLSLTSLSQCLRSIRRSPGGTSRTALRGRCLALWRMSFWQ
uniref:Annexin n=1 Tax=Oncorhynchus mykiss TaxID=8022 RepID=A0A8C7S027_ONCMY